MKVLRFVYLKIYELFSFTVKKTLSVAFSPLDNTAMFLLCCLVFVLGGGGGGHGDYC